MILYDGRVVVFKMEGDVMMYVVGGGEENEVLLYSVVLCLRDALGILLKYVAVLVPCWAAVASAASWAVMGAWG